jgi:hypothetical protein
MRGGEMNISEMVITELRNCQRKGRRNRADSSTRRAVTRA